MASNLQNFKEQSPLYPDVLDAVNKEFALMMARNMDFSPSPEDLPIVAKVLASDLLASGITDIAAIRKGLEAAGRTYEKWPATALIISLCRPKREPLAHRLLAHEENKHYTPEQVQRFHSIIGGIKEKLGIKPDRKLTDEEEDQLLVEASQKMRESGEKHGLTEDQIAGL